MSFDFLRVELFWRLTFYPGPVCSALKLNRLLFDSLLFLGQNSLGNSFHNFIAASCAQMFLRYSRVSSNRDLRFFQSQRNPGPRFTAPTTGHVSRFFKIPGNAEQPDSYNSGGFYPVHLGDKIANRYKVVRKLGWGTCATVWLAVDDK